MIGRCVCPSLYTTGKCAIRVSSSQYKFHRDLSDPCCDLGRNDREVIVYFISTIVSVEYLNLFNNSPVGSSGQCSSVIDKVKHNGNNDGSRFCLFSSESYLLLSLEI